MSSESSPDPIESAAKGLTKGTLEWTHERLKEWVIKFKNRDLAFIKDIETINLVKEQRETGEWDFFKKYVKDSELRILFQMGLTLRKLEKEKKYLELDALKKKTFNKFNTKGLHIAEFVQNGLFSKYIGNRLNRAVTSHKLKSEIDDLFKNFENRVAFIQAIHQEKIEKKADEIITKIQANSPDTFIISGSGLAIGVCEQIKEKVLSAISGYEEELYKVEDKKIFFLNRIEDLSF